MIYHETIHYYCLSKCKDYRDNRYSHFEVGKIYVFTPTRLQKIYDKLWGLNIADSEVATSTGIHYMIARGKKTILVLRVHVYLYSC